MMEYPFRLETITEI